MDNSVKEGTLAFRPKKQFIKKLKDHYVLLFNNSVNGLARLEVYENNQCVSKGSYTLMIVGSNVIKVQKMEPGHDNEDNNAFMVDTKTQNQYTFFAKNSDECNQWVKIIQNILFRPIVDSQGNTRAEPDTLTEENELYLPAEEVIREFSVTLGAETRLKLAADSPVRLLVERGTITIFKEGNRIMRWGIEHLRRIGYTIDNFHIEAGRKSESGEGEFHFLTTMGKKIHNLMVKEKETCRQMSSGKLKISPLVAGQVSISVPHEDSPFLTQGNHIYEDLSSLGVVQNIAPSNGPPITNITSPPSTEQFRITQHNMTNTSTSIIQKPAKPPRLNSSSNPDVLSLSTPQASQSNSQTTKSLGTLVGPTASKSFTTNMNVGSPGGMQPTDEEPTYNNLSHVHLLNTEEDNYHPLRNHHPMSDTRQLEATRKKNANLMRQENTERPHQQQKDVKTEVIYSYIDKSKKKKNQQKAS